MPTPTADETAIRDGHHFAKIFAFDAIRAANRVHCRPLGGEGLLSPERFGRATNSPTAWSFRKPHGKHEGIRTSHLVVLFCNVIDLQRRRPYSMNHTRKSRTPVRLFLSENTQNPRPTSPEEPRDPNTQSATQPPANAEPNGLNPRQGRPIIRAFP